MRDEVMCDGSKCPARKVCGLCEQYKPCREPDLRALGAEAVRLRVESRAWAWCAEKWASPMLLRWGDRTFGWVVRDEWGNRLGPERTDPEDGHYIGWDTPLEAVLAAQAAEEAKP